MAGDKYAALRAEFVAGTMTPGELAQRHGLPEKRLQDVAARQGWYAAREENAKRREAIAKKAEEIAVARAAQSAAEKVAEHWAQARIQAATVFLASQKVQSEAIKALLSGENPPSAHEARAIMGSAVDGIRGLHMATGEPTEITEHRGGLALADRETLDAMIQEVMKE